MNMEFMLAVPRIVVGLLMVGHGLQKLAGWFGGPGLRGTAGFLTTLRIQSAPRWAVIVGLTETIGGALMALGLFEPLGQLAVATVLLSAIALVHWRQGLWASNGGMELPLVLLTVALASAAAPLRVGIDAALGLAVPAWLTLLVAAALAAGAIFAVATRRPAGAPDAARRPAGVQVLRVLAWRRRTAFRR